MQSLFDLKLQEKAGAQNKLSREVTGFLSGASTDSIILAYINTGKALGMDIQTCGHRHMEMAGKYAAEGGKVFIDSGAFGVRQRGGEINFPEVFQKYHQLIAKAQPHPKNLSLVMPDVIGDQEKTLELLNLHKEDVDAIKAAGARTIIPAQGGKLNLSELYDQYVDMFGNSITVGIPSKMDATPKELVRKFFLKSKPGDVHMLGLGINGRTKSYIQMLLNDSPNTKVTVDATWHRKFVGKNRPITEARKESILEATQEEVAACDIWDPHQELDSPREAQTIADTYKCFGATKQAILDANDQGNLPELLENYDPSFQLHWETTRKILEIRSGKVHTQKAIEEVILQKQV